MREFYLEIRDALNGGIAPHERTRMGSFLEECFNLKPSQYGLIPVQELVDPFDGALGEDVFPFPQLFHGEEETLLLREASLFKVNTLSIPWTFEEVPLFDPLNHYAPAKVIGRGQWHIADFGASWFLFNGRTTIFQTGHETLQGTSPITYAQSRVPISTGTTFRGRVLTGGFEAGRFWGSSWKAMFSEWHAKQQEPFALQFDEIKENFVAWSSIGGGDFPIWLFQPHYSYDTGPGVDLVIEKFQRGDLGFMPMPWQGTVFGIKPLGGRVIVYGEGGICALNPVSGGGNIPPTFGIQNILSSGIAGRGAFGGDEKGHVFVDQEGWVWNLTGELQLQRLGFSYLLSGTEPVVSYNQHLEEWYITTDDRAFILNSHGLSETHQRVVSVNYAQGASLGTFHIGRRKVEDELASITTKGFDFDVRGIKTITNIRVDYEGSGLVEVAVDYRYNRHSPFRQSRWFRLNKEGITYLRISGVEFRISVRAYDWHDFYLDRLHIGWQLSDKRHTRGPYANTPIT